MFLILTRIRSSLQVVLVFIFLIAKDGKHITICLLTICSSLVRCQLSKFAYLLIRLFFWCLTSLILCIYILDNNSCWFNSWQIFSHALNSLIFYFMSLSCLIFHFVQMVYFWGRILLCSLDWPGTHYLDHTRSKFIKSAQLCLQDAWIKRMCPWTWHIYDVCLMQSHLTILGFIPWITEVVPRVLLPLSTYWKVPSVFL